MEIEIKYTDGTSRLCSDDMEQVSDMLRSEMGCEPVIYGGLVWTDVAAADHPDDDGAHAFAELLIDGQRID